MEGTSGRVHSLQSLGTVDGPGVRFVVFMQGCNLRCSCCHNPDTWECGIGREYSGKELADIAERYKDYFGRDGGITVSGGEPLLQADFVYELFSHCKEKGINTCLDTSGSILTESVRELLAVTDRVLLDIKYTRDSMYRKYVGCSIDCVLDFLSYLNVRSIPTTLRQVIIPDLNDGEDNIAILNEIAKSHPNVDRVELLPFRKICQVKYDDMGITFPLADTPEPDDDTMKKLREKLCF